MRDITLSRDALAPLLKHLTAYGVSDFHPGGRHFCALLRASSAHFSNRGMPIIFTCPVKV